MPNPFVFQKAVKSQEKLRLALDGPTGGGKTWTALVLGSYLAAKEGGRVALIDSERSSAKKYAKDFDFDHLTLPDFDPNTYIGAVKAAVAAGYVVVIIDSLTHAWEGTLELKDNVARRSNSGNSYDAWRHVTPIHNELVDVLTRSPVHIIVTMRTKTEYLVETGEGGKMTGVKKIGLKPIQRDGLEYEFDIVGDMDQENTLVVSKTRCSALTGAVIRKPDEVLAATLYEWLVDGEPVVDGDEASELVAALDAITDKALRQQAKHEFLAVFGRPEQVLASRLGDARRWIEDFTDSQIASGDAEGVSGKVAPPAAPDTPTAQVEPVTPEAVSAAFDRWTELPLEIRDEADTALGSANLPDWSDSSAVWTRAALDEALAIIEAAEAKVGAAA